MRGVNKFYKEYRLSDLAKSKVNIKQIQAEFKQTAFTNKKKGTGGSQKTRNQKLN